MSLAPLDKKEKGKGIAPLYLLTGLLLFLIVAGVALVKFYEREKPQVAMLADISHFGLTKEVAMALTDAKSGVRSVTVLLAQDQKQATLFRKDYPRQAYWGSLGPNRVEESFTVDSRSLGFRDGPAELRITV